MSGKVVNGIRACDVHKGGHGALYRCEHYDKETLAEIDMLTDQHVNDLNNPEWVKKQLDNGVPPIGIEIWRALAGL
jgi:hypothetical protein